MTRQRWGQFVGAFTPALLARIEQAADRIVRLARRDEQEFLWQVAAARRRCGDDGALIVQIMAAGDDLPLRPLPLGSVRVRLESIDGIRITDEFLDHVRSQALYLRDDAADCANSLARDQSVDVIGPFGTVTIKPGDRVGIRQGALFCSTHRSYDDRWRLDHGKDVAVHRITGGFVDRYTDRQPVIVQPEIHWIDADGARCWTVLQEIVPDVDPATNVMPAPAMEA